MAQHNHLLHLHLRNKKHVTTFDKVMFCAAFLYPFTGIPQVIQVINGNTDGVSVLSWAGFALFVSIFLIYSIIHKIKPMIITYTMWWIIDVAVVIGVLVHR